MARRNLGIVPAIVDSPSKVTLKMDRERLAEIAADKAILLSAMQLASAIQEIRDVESLLERLLSEIRECIPADRLSVLQPDLQPAAPSPSPFQIATDIAAEAQRERMAIVLRGTPTVLCAPLRCNKSDLGVIYLEYSKPETYMDRDLRMLAAIAPIAASALDHAHYIAGLQGQKTHLERYAYINHDLVGNSPAIREVHSFIRKVADSNSTVLILGESGTGKELVARGIHGNSSRKNKAFIPVNCGAIQPELMENELFGHEKGSFTSAEVAVEGLVDVANGGTLFLDEIGEMPLAIQVKMLRLLQEREYRRVGGTRILHADVRIVAATNRDLKDWVKQGRFREDLFYRLNVAAIRTPSLSQMREDIALITNRLLVKLRDAKPVAGISEEALKVLMAYHWPGNVRQLQNALECAALMCERGKIVQPEHLPSYVWETETPEIPTGGYYESMHQHQMKIVQNALIQTAGAYPEAARLLGISERYLRTLAHTHKLDT